MKSNPGILSHKATVVLRNDDGAIEAVYLGWSYTMARNHYVTSVMEQMNVTRDNALNIVDRKWTFEENVQVVGYKPLKRKSRNK